ncbi:hypothetical protein U2A4042520037 [Corynebacterium striatum]|nr:hypothetical protein U2A4042520037 [Corynebacterium striatum]
MWRTVEDWSRLQVGFRHPEGVFEVVELVVKANDISTRQLFLGQLVTSPFRPASDKALP